MADFSALFEQRRGEFLKGWSEFLRFASVSNDPRSDGECRACVRWLEEHLTAIGFTTSVIETTGKPIVFGEYRHPEATKTILYYGHYDVQPPEPLDLWISKPFEPVIRDGRMYARGALDNKGQTWYALSAFETLIRGDLLRCNLKVIIEGEEETGSSGIAEALPSIRDRVQGDVLLVCDSGTVKAGVGTITMGLRGITALECELHGPKKDLHSGIHGGAVRNPATEMARLVASLHNPDGSVAVEGFYDGVTPPSAEESEKANLLPFSAAEYEAQIGAPPVGGESGFSFAERTGLRPTIEVNGIHSGYDGPGGKTIIPSSAILKLSARLVAGQDPAEVLKKIADHLRAHTPEGVRLVIKGREHGGPAVLVPLNEPVVRVAAEVLERITGQPAVFIWLGASIPVISKLSEISGAPALMVGFGLEEDNMHAPNESFSLDQFRQGFLYICEIITTLSAKTSCRRN